MFSNIQHFLLQFLNVVLPIIVRFRRGRARSFCNSTQRQRGTRNFSDILKNSRHLPLLGFSYFVSLARDTSSLETFDVGIVFFLSSRTVSGTGLGTLINAVSDSHTIIVPSLSVLCKIARTLTRRRRNRRFRLIRIVSFANQSKYAILDARNVEMNSLTNQFIGNLRRVRNYQPLARIGNRTCDIIRVRFLFLQDEFYQRIRARKLFV